MQAPAVTVILAASSASSAGATTTTTSVIAATSLDATTLKTVISNRLVQPTIGNTYLLDGPSACRIAHHRRQACHDWRSARRYGLGKLRIVSQYVEGSHVGTIWCHFTSLRSSSVTTSTASPAAATAPRCAGSVLGVAGSCFIALAMTLGWLLDWLDGWFRLFLRVVP